MEESRHQIHRVVKHMEEAWNKSDSAGFARPFVEDADFINIRGAHYNGRSAIEAGHRHLFDTIYKGSENQFTVESIRFVGADVAIAFVRSNLKWYEGGATREGQARPSMLLARSKGDWHIVVLQNTLVAPEGAR